MLLSARVARMRLSRLSALAALFFVLTAGSASAALVPTQTYLTTTPSTNARPGQVVVPLVTVEIPGGGPHQFIPGTVDYYVCPQAASPDACATGGTFLGTKSALGGWTQIGGPLYTPPRPGFYCFRAEYSGASTHSPSQAYGQSGCVTVTTQVTMTKTYTSPPVVGQPFAVTFDLKDAQGNPVEGSLVVGDSCGADSGGPFAQTIPLVGGKATTRSYTPTSTTVIPYSWSFKALGYQLDSGCTWIEVDGAPTTTTLSPSATSVGGGQAITLTSRVTAAGAAGTPKGFVRFYACGPQPSAAACVGGTQIGNGPALVDGTATSPGFTPKVEGFYCFRAEYIPGANRSFTESSVAGPTACTQLVRAGAGITFALDRSGTLDQDVAIAARVTRPGHTPTGRIRFLQCGPLAAPDGCANPTRSYTEERPLQDGEALSLPFRPTVPGYYCLWAEYEGDAQTPGMTESGASSCFSITQWGSTTSLRAPEEVVLAGGKGATGRTFGVGVATTGPAAVAGTVEAWACGPLRDPVGCPSGGVSLGRRAVVGGAATTNEVVGTGAGYYCLRAEFTSSDARVKDSVAGGSGAQPSCMRIRLTTKVLSIAPMTKVEGQPDPTPRLAGPDDPSISGSMKCISRDHSEAPGTYATVYYCELGSLTSTDWELSLPGTFLDLTITPRPVVTPTPTPTPTPSPTGDGTGGVPAPTPAPIGNTPDPGAGASPTPTVVPPGGGSTPPGGGTGQRPESTTGPNDLVAITGLTTRRGGVTATLRLPGAGRVLVTVQAGKRRVTRAVSAKRGGKATMTFTAKQLRKLTAGKKRGKKVKLTVQAKFTPAGGAARTVGPRTVSVKVA